MDRPRGQRRRSSAPAFVAALLMISVALFTSQAEARTPKLPKGAVKVAPWNVASVAKGVWCAKAPGRWKFYVPGRKIVLRRGKGRKTYFVTSLRLAENSRSSAEARRFENTHRRYLKRCRQVRPLRFNFKRAIGLALTTKKKKGQGRLRATSAGSSLKALLPAGNLRDAIESGKANVDNYWFGPDGRIFLEIIPGVDLTDATVVPKEGGCAFVEVDRGTGIPTCVDWDIVNLMTSGSVENRSFVQFDSKGNVYYTGYVQDTRKKNWNIKRVLRRKSVGGNITDLVSWNKEVFEFVVLPDGEVIAVVAREGTDGNPFREFLLQRVSPVSGGSPDTLWSGRGAPVLFPDGNVYFANVEFEAPGRPGPGDVSRIHRYLPEEGIVDPKPWLSSSPVEDAHLPYSGACEALGMECPTLTVGGRGTVTTAGGRVVSASMAAPKGPGSLQTFITQVFPEVALFPSPIRGDYWGIDVGEKILMTGLAVSNRKSSLLALLDLETGEQRVLLDEETSGLGPQYLAVNRSGDAAFMVAERGGKQILCRVDLKTYEVSILREVRYEGILRFDAFEFER